MKPSRPSRTRYIPLAIALTLAASVAGSLAAQDLTPPPSDWVPFDPARRTGLRPQTGNPVGNHRMSNAFRVEHRDLLAVKEGLDLLENCLAD